VAREYEDGPAAIVVDPICIDRRIGCEPTQLRSQIVERFRNERMPDWPVPTPAGEGPRYVTRAMTAGGRV
jgi:hypothetical protein